MHVANLAEITSFADRVRETAHFRELAGEYPSDLVETMRELGLFGSCSGDLVDYASAMEEIGRAWLSLVPIVNAHSSSVWVMKQHGTPAQQERWLDPLRAGRSLSCLGLTEPRGGSDLARTTSSARRDGDGWRLNAHKTLITHADHAHHMLILARTEPDEERGSRALSLFLIDRAQWIVRRPLPKFGTRGVETCELVVEEAFVPADRLIGEVPGRGLAQILDALEVGRIAVAAAAVGVARSALWRAIERVREREAFGQPLAENPVVQQRIALMTTRIAAAKGLVRLAAERKRTGGRHDVETSAAKIAATDAAMHAATVALELGGGAGYTDDLDFTRHLRDASLFLAGEGANGVLESLIGARMVQAVPDLAWV